MSNKVWSVYLIETFRGAIYTGITTDVNRRFNEHQANSAKTAKSLRGKGPLTLRFEQPVGDKSTALKLEYRIKRLPKKKKDAIINHQLAILSLLTTE